MDPPAGLLAAGLTVTGVLLAAPVSALLARARWPSRSPRAALVLWQAVCLGAGLSLVGAGVVLAVAPFPGSFPAAAWSGFTGLLTGRVFDELPGWRIAAGLAAVALAGALLTVLIRCAVLTLRRRRAHRDLLDLLTTPSPFTPGGVRETAAEVSILDHHRAVAYTLPGFHARIVLSVGLLDLLDVDQLGAVVEHERAHLRSRHDLLALPFQAWAAALGWVPGVRPARRAVAELTEMLADDAATTRSSPAVLAAALARVALAGDARPGDGLAGSTELPTASGSAEADGAQITRRVRRLVAPSPLPGRRTALVYFAAAVLISLPPVLLVLGW